jgi:hypothetical protein
VIQPRGVLGQPSLGLASSGHVGPGRGRRFTADERSEISKYPLV